MRNFKLGLIFKLFFLSYIYSESIAYSYSQELNDSLDYYKERIETKSVSVVGKKYLDKSLITNFENVLKGKMSGLNVMKTSGDEPGNSSSQLYIRGAASYNQYRSPLYMVDGVERNINNIDVEEVEAVSVFKDGASNSRYGQRGANGIVFIRTKRGFVGKPVISFSSQFGIQQPFRLPEYLSSKDYVSLYNKALLNDGLSIPQDDRYNPEMYDGNHNQYLYPDVDWYSSMLKETAFQQQYKLSVQGGSERIKYFIFFGFVDQNGLYKYTDLNDGYNTNIKYNRYNLRSNIDAKVTNSLNISLDIAGRIEDKNMPNSSSSDVFGALSTLPPNAMPIIYEDGKIAGTSQYKNNPYGLISHTGYRNDVNTFLEVTARANQKLDMFIKGLSIDALVAFDSNSGYGKGKTSGFATYELQRDNSYTVYGEDKQLSLSQEKLYDFYQYQLVFDAGLSYNRTFGKHNLSIDMSYYQSHFNVQGDNPAYSRQGIKGGALYNYNNKYIGEFNFSYDGSSEYAPGNRFGFFPSVSGAWIISNEEFFCKDIVNYLKIRTSYGEAGNSKTGFERYAYQSNWSGFDQSYGGYIFGSGFAWSDGAWEGRIANPNLTWESIKSFNFGIDLELLSKLSFSVDVFRDKRIDIVSEKSNTTSWVIGAPFPYVNIGKVLNRGIEFSVEHRNKINKFSYYVLGNFSFARNKILAFDEVSSLKDYQKRVGKPIDQLWGLECLGFYTSDEDIANSPISSFYKVQPGDLKYKNQNPSEDNHINTYDEVPIGKPTVPEINYGLTAGFELYGFDFSASLSGVANRSVYLCNSAIWGLKSNKATDIMFGAWEKGVNEENATYPRLTTENNLNNYRSSSFWIKNGNFLRFDNLEIGYQLPNKILKSINIKQIRFYISGHNLFSFDGLKKYNLDPEVLDAGITGYPVMRSFNFGLNIKF